MPVTCAVLNCCSTKVPQSLIKFFRIPAICKTNAVYFKLSKRRQRLWLRRLRWKQTELINIKYKRICELHFVSGKYICIYRLPFVLRFLFFHCFIYIISILNYNL